MLHIYLALLSIESVRDVRDLKDCPRNMAWGTALPDSRGDLDLQLRSQRLSRAHLDKQEDSLIFVNIPFLSNTDAIGDLGQGFCNSVDFGRSKSDP